MLRTNLCVAIVSLWYWVSIFKFTYILNNAIDRWLQRLWSKVDTAQLIYYNEISFSMSSINNSMQPVGDSGHARPFVLKSAMRVELRLAIRLKFNSRALSGAYAHKRFALRSANMQFWFMQIAQLVRAISQIFCIYHTFIRLHYFV